jgi:hypothetical protein
MNWALRGRISKATRLEFICPLTMSIALFALILLVMALPILRSLEGDTTLESETARCIVGEATFDDSQMRSICRDSNL